MSGTSELPTIALRPRSSLTHVGENRTVPGIIAQDGVLEEATQEAHGAPPHHVVELRVTHHVGERSAKKKVSKKRSRAARAALERERRGNPERAAR